VSERVGAFGGRCTLVGVDVDRRAADDAGRSLPDARILLADALGRDWRRERFDLVVGNPPFLSQMATATTRGGSSDLGGGPYADAAAEFLALAARLVESGRGRVALVLPQSILSARDAGDVRAEYDRRAEMIWSWWTDERLFDANVFTCALAFEFGHGGRATPRASWSGVVTRRQRIPELPDALETAGTLGDRARLNANFRDEYYGMIPAVGDHAGGPPLVTSGLIDPGINRWGSTAVTFARRRFTAPRVDVGALDERMQRWARDRLIPKVLVANQTRIVEAVCDPTGEWLPAVPVVAAYPDDGDAATAWEIAALLTSPVASAWAWARSGGTGLSASAIRLGPVMLAALPWPTGPLHSAVASLQAGDVRGCGSAVTDAFGLGDRVDLVDWWRDALDRIDTRRTRIAAASR
ncbi:MAG: hypothetical protein ACR2O6_10005, partial [Ilumatobacteraceae bacterium]